MTQSTDDKENLEQTRVQKPERNPFEQREEEVAVDRMMQSVFNAPEAPHSEAVLPPFVKSNNVVARSSQEDCIQVIALPDVVPGTTAKSNPAVGSEKKSDVPACDAENRSAIQQVAANDSAGIKRTIGVPQEPQGTAPQADQPIVAGGKLIRMMQPAGTTVEVAAPRTQSVAAAPVGEQKTIESKSVCDLVTKICAPATKVSEEKTAGTTSDADKRNLTFSSDNSCTPDVKPLAKAQIAATGDRAPGTQPESTAQVARDTKSNGTTSPGETDPRLLPAAGSIPRIGKTPPTDSPAAAQAEGTVHVAPDTKSNGTTSPGETDPRLLPAAGSIPRIGRTPSTDSPAVAHADGTAHVAPGTKSNGTTSPGETERRLLPAAGSIPRIGRTPSTDSPAVASPTLQSDTRVGHSPDGSTNGTGKPAPAQAAEGHPSAPQMVCDVVTKVCVLVPKVIEEKAVIASPKPNARVTIPEGPTCQPEAPIAKPVPQGVTSTGRVIAPNGPADAPSNPNRNGANAPDGQAPSGTARTPGAHSTEQNGTALAIVGDLAKTCPPVKNASGGIVAAEAPVRIPAAQPLPRIERANNAPPGHTTVETPGYVCTDTVCVPITRPGEARTGSATRQTGERVTPVGPTCAPESKPVVKPVSGSPVDGALPQAGRDGTGNGRVHPTDAPSAQIPASGIIPRISNATTSERGNATTSERGNVTTPERGNATTPERGNVTTPERGNATTPERGNATTPERGNATTPERGNATTPERGNAPAGEKGNVPAVEKGSTSGVSVTSDKTIPGGSEVRNDWKQSDFAKLPTIVQNIDIRNAQQIDNTATISTRPVTSEIKAGNAQESIASAARPTTERQVDQARNLSAEGTKEKASTQSGSKESHAPVQTTGRDGSSTNAPTGAKDGSPIRTGNGTDLSVTTKPTSSSSVDVSQQSVVRDNSSQSNREIPATRQSATAQPTSENKVLSGKSDGAAENRAPVLKADPAAENRALGVKSDMPADNRGLSNRSEAVPENRVQSVKSDLPADNRGPYQPADKIAQNQKGDKEQENKVTKKDDKDETAYQIVWGLVDQSKSRANKTEKKEKTETKRTPAKATQKRAKYIVRKGDTIESIALKELKDARFTNLIITINRGTIRFVLKDGAQEIVLRVGQALWLPNQTERDVYARAIFHTKRTAATSRKPQAAVLSTEETEEQLPEVTLMNSLPNNLEPPVPPPTTLISLISSLNKIRQAGQRTPVQLSEIDYEVSQSKLLTKLNTVAETVDSGIWFDSEAPTELNQNTCPASRSGAGTPKGALEANTKGPSTLIEKFFEDRDSVQRNIIEKLAETCRVVTSQGSQCQDDFNTELQIEVQSSWMTVAAYEYRRGHGYRYTYYDSSEQRPFPMDLPLSVVLEMAREDFSRNWSVYCKEFSKQRAAAKAAE